MTFSGDAFYTAGYSVNVANPQKNQIIDMISSVMLISLVIIQVFVYSNKV